MEKSNRHQPWGMQRSNTVPTSDTPATQGWQRSNTVTAATPGVKVDEVKRGYVPRNNAYQGQFDRVYEPEVPRPDEILATSQPQFHSDPNKIFTLHQQPDDSSCRDNGYNANGNGLSPRATFEKSPRNALPIPPKPSIREEMGLRPETRRAYESQSNVARRAHDRSPTGSDASLPDTGREAALRSSRLPSGSTFLYPARDGKESSSRHPEVLYYSKDSSSRHPEVLYYSKYSSSRHPEVLYSKYSSSRHPEVLYYSKDSSSRHPEVLYSKYSSSRHPEVLYYSKYSSSRHPEVLYSKYSSSRHPEVLYSKYSSSRHPEVLYYSKYSSSRHPEVLYSKYSSSRHPEVLYSKYSSSRHPEVLYSSSRHPEVL